MKGKKCVESKKAYNKRDDNLWKVVFAEIGTVTSDDQGIYIAGHGPFNEDLIPLSGLITVVDRRYQEKFNTEAHKAYKAIMGRIQRGTCTEVDAEMLKEVSKYVHD